MSSPHPISENQLGLLVSTARLQPYVDAANAAGCSAIDLYLNNEIASKELYVLLGRFEIVLRNAIDKHYRAKFRSNNWLLDQLQRDGMFTDGSLADSKNNINRLIEKFGNNVSNDKLVSELSFGFWVHLFNKKPFRRGGQSLLEVLQNRPPNYNQSAAYNDLKLILGLRNRIAHHEPLIIRDGRVQRRYLTQKLSLIQRWNGMLGPITSFSDVQPFRERVAELYGR